MAPATLPEFSLEGRVFVVTGGARGLGLVQIRALLESGARRVYSFDVLPKVDEDFLVVQSSFPLSTPAPATATATSGSAGESTTSKLAYVRVDVTSEKEVEAAFDAVAEKEKRLDGVVAGAGIIIERPALEVGEQEFRKVLDVNVLGVFLTAKHAARVMLSKNDGRRGSILLVASMSGHIANKDCPYISYNSSKSAVLQMTRSFAAELGGKGIRVNSLSPGHIRTPLTEKLLADTPGREALWGGSNPLGRMAEPHEFRGITVFLMSDASTYANGADFKLDGGHTVW